MKFIIGIKFATIFFMLIPISLKDAYSQERNVCGPINLKTVVLTDRKKLIGRKYGIGSNRKDVDIHLSNLAKSVLKTIKSKNYEFSANCKVTYIHVDKENIYFQFKTESKMKYEMKIFASAGRLKSLCINRNNIAVEAPHPQDRDFPHVEKPLSKYGLPQVPSVHFLALCISSDGVKQEYRKI